VDECKPLVGGGGGGGHGAWLEGDVTDTLVGRCRLTLSNPR